MVKSISVAFALFFLAGPMVSAADIEPPYYYFQGKKVQLNFMHMIAVRLLQGIDATIVFKNIIDSRLNFSFEQLEEHHLWMINVKNALTHKDILLLSRRFASHPGVEFSVPVFSSGSEHLVVADEFIVKFKEDVSEFDILRFNMTNSVIVARKGPTPDSLVLKVTRQSMLNALEMANLYYEQGMAVYSHPNFIRMVQRY